MTLVTQLRSLRNKARFRIGIYGFFTFTFAGTLLSEISEGRVVNSANFFILAMLALSVWKLYAWIVNFRLLGEYPNYLHEIAIADDLRTCDLARKLGITQDKLLKNTNRLMTLGLLPLVTAKKDGDYMLGSMKDHPVAAWMKDAKKEKMIYHANLRPVKCTSCGAESLVPRRQTKPCPYCGAGLRKV